MELCVRIGVPLLQQVRFRQIVCRDLVKIIDLPWFSGDSTLTSMGSNARSGLLNLLKKFGKRRKFRGKLRGLGLPKVWDSLSVFMVAEANKLLKTAVHPPLDSMALSHSLCEKQQQEERSKEKKRTSPRSTQELQLLSSVALRSWGGDAG